MFTDDPAAPLRRESKLYLAPLLCAVACIIIMRAGVIAVFFLIPLGFCFIVFGQLAAWFSFILAVLGNAVLSVGFSLAYGAGLAGAGIEIAYFAVLALGYTWVMAGNPPYIQLPIPHVRTVFRFTAASVAGTLTFLGMVFVVGRMEGLFSVFRTQAEAIAAAFITASGADAAQQAYLERTLTPDRIIDTIVGIILRGGALFSFFAMLFLSRQLAYIIARVVRRKGEHFYGDLIAFHVPPRTMWVLIICLPAIMIFRMISLEIAEIAVWNVLIICIMMFLAQGGGIVLFNLVRRPMTGTMRLFTGIFLVFMLFSPGINFLAIGALVLLGIAENWLPLRKS
jgi:hypothetical protein